MDLDTQFMWETLLETFAGIPVALKLTVVTLIVSLPLGFLMAVSKIEKRKISSKIITVYVSFIRGTPMILQILFFYSLLPSLLNYIVKTVLALDYNVFNWDYIIYAYVVFIINTTAVLTEVFRSALLTVDQGQLEAGLSIGMTKFQTYVRVIIPQALVSALPNLTNTTMNLLKSTSLAYMMGVKEITSIARTAASYGYKYIEAYLDIFFVYLVLCTVLQLIFRVIEKRVSHYKQLVTG